MELRSISSFQVLGFKGSHPLTGTVDRRCFFTPDRHYTICESQEHEVDQAIVNLCLTVAVRSFVTTSHLPGLSPFTLSQRRSTKRKPRRTRERRGHSANFDKLGFVRNVRALMPQSEQA
jgi:hypothetical protein